MAVMVTMEPVTNVVIPRCETDYTNRTDGAVVYNILDPYLVGILLTSQAGNWLTWFGSVHPGKYRDCTSIRPRPRPS